MNEKRLFSVLKGPYTTEKSVRISEKNQQVVFKVANDATKTEISKAIEKLFNAVVESVQIVRVKGKTKRFKQAEGRRGDWKKAYISLKEGHEINVANYQ